MAFYLQNLNNLQLGVHHHHIFVVGQEVAFPVAEGRRCVREAVRHATTHHHLSHHFTHSVDGAQDIVACAATSNTTAVTRTSRKLLVSVFYVQLEAVNEYFLNLCCCISSDSKTSKPEMSSNYTKR